MNWRKGFFRLWVLFSIIWVLIVVYAYFRNSPFVDGTTMGDQNSTDCAINPKAGPWCNYYNKLAKVIVSIPNGPVFLVKEPDNMTGEEVANFVSVNQSVMIPEISVGPHKENWPRFIIGMILTMASFPMAVLVSSGAIFWVFSGFKGRASR